MLQAKWPTFYTEKLFSWYFTFILLMWQKYMTINLSSLFPGPWFSGAELILWRLLLAADACSTGERELQEPAVGTPRGPTGEQLHFYAGSQPGRFTSGGAGGHLGSTTTLSLRHLPRLRTTGQLLRREDRKKWKNVRVPSYPWCRIRS